MINCSIGPKTRLDLHVILATNSHARHLPWLQKPVASNLLAATSSNPVSKIIQDHICFKFHCLYRQPPRVQTFQKQHNNTGSLLHPTWSSWTILSSLCPTDQLGPGNLNPMLSYSYTLEHLLRKPKLCTAALPAYP